MTSKHYYKIMLWFIGISLLICVIHALIVNRLNLSLVIGVPGVYVFNLVFSVLLTFVVFRLKEKLKESISWIYLSGVFLKLGIFALIFNGIVFKEINFTQFQKYIIVFPSLLFFAIEALIVYRIIRTQKK